jgi:signal transduction histidine kinase
MFRQQITQTTIFRVLIAGFMLVILLLLVAGFITVHKIQSIKRNVADLVEEGLVATRLIDDIQREQAALSAVFYKLSRDPEYVDREKILSELDDTDKRIEQIGDSVTGTPEEALWDELQKATAAFSAEARRMLSLENPTTLLSRDLFRRHEESLRIVAKLAAVSYDNASAARQQIDRRFGELIRQSAILLGACLLLALLCAILTVRLTIGLLRKMEWQTSELSRVSWHLLESQETTARRFSHELHDELGQSLTAAKANLLALQAQPGQTSQRLEDCIRLVNKAIQNVRELSQLLHPTILDDFGLDAALRWLSEGFTTRTGIEVEYKSSFTARLPDETETHLFRICQEALTNIARHSGASRVHIGLRSEGERINLSVGDNGRGLGPGGRAEQQGLGLIGMRARARSAGGELAIRSADGAGLVIDVTVPVRGVRHEEDPDLVGR